MDITSAESVFADLWDEVLILYDLQLLPIQLACDLNPPLAQLLDSAAGARDVKELPLWLVKPLVTLGSCKTTTPKIYSKKTLAKLKASASHQLLHHLSPYYYEVGCEVSELLGDAEINSAITAAYVQRYKDILDRFGHMEDKGAGKFKGCLTLFEQRCKFYNAFQQSSFKSIVVLINEVHFGSVQSGKFYGTPHTSMAHAQARSHSSVPYCQRQQASPGLI